MTPFTSSWTLSMVKRLSKKVSALDFSRNSEMLPFWNRKIRIALGLIKLIRPWRFLYGSWLEVAALKLIVQRFSLPAKICNNSAKNRRICKKLAPKSRAKFPVTFSVEVGATKLTTRDLASHATMTNFTTPTQNSAAFQAATRNIKRPMLDWVTNYSLQFMKFQSSWLFFQ